jgi:hypothetical protein
MADNRAERTLGGAADSKTGGDTPSLEGGPQGTGESASPAAHPTPPTEVEASGDVRTEPRQADWMLTELRERVAAMVRSIEERVAKLREGEHLIPDKEAVLRQIEQAVQEMTRHLEQKNSSNGRSG